MIQDNSQVYDWIKISIRYPGYCFYCKSKIKHGDYGYWSKSSKLLSHDYCYESKLPKSRLDPVSDSQNDMNKVYGDDNQVNRQLCNFINKNNNKIRCYICKNLIDLTNDLIITLLHIEKNYGGLDILYCSDCLKDIDPKVFSNYRKSFLNDLSSFS